MSEKLINLVAADMGYGHQRAAYPLMDIGGGKIVTINDYQGIPDKERKYWKDSLDSYEKISRLKKVPILGRLVFSIMDSFQKIQPFYPFRDLSDRSIQQEFYMKSIEAGLGKKLIEELDENGLPFVTTFFVAAYAADYFNYKGDIYCIVCDSDISRAWAPPFPEKSRINYFVPSDRVKERLLMYGVDSRHIFVTGFPLPKENIGDNEEIVGIDMAKRMRVLDPEGHQAEYYDFIQEKYPEVFMPKEAPRPLTITFAVGGAGAQKEVGEALVKNLAVDIRSGKYHLNLVAGSRPEVKDYFEKVLVKSGFSSGQGIDIIFAPDKIEYFRLLNARLRDTDVLWTKPSEMSFYCGLGLPIIISSPVGSQEDYNRAWLLAIGSGIDSLNLDYVSEWLGDFWRSGRLARAAVDGFLSAEKMGAYKIEKVFSKDAGQGGR